jgi:Peptidase family M28
MFSKIFILILFSINAVNLYAQEINDSISEQYIGKTISFLASDKLKGRVNHTKEQLEAAEFISKEFKRFGLSPFPEMNNYQVPFITNTLQGLKDAELKWNKRKVADSLFIFLPHSIYTDTLTRNDFLHLKVYPLFSDSLLFQHWGSTQRLIFDLQLSDSIRFQEVIKNIQLPVGNPSSDILITAQDEEPTEVNFSGNKNLLSSVLYNVVGMLPGKTKPNEAIIFSAHYDHIDEGIDGNTGVFNGANDDASGTTAVLALAKYFATRKDNERTIIFCLFAGEELGMLGSKAFVEMIEPENIKAVINIEMIGITNATGKNAFMLTGPANSNLMKILSANLGKGKFKITGLYNDSQRLFYRSDNYSFFQRGIVAHTIMCSDDDDPCYHRQCDDVERIDIANMTRVIQAIAKSASTLINGTETPVKH